MFRFYQVILILGLVALFRPGQINIFLILFVSLIYALSKYMLVLIGRSDALVPYQMVPIV